MIDSALAIQIAEALAIPSHSDGIRFVTRDRLDRIREFLKDSRYQCVHDGHIFQLYAQKPIREIGQNILLLSSHADCLQLAPVFEQRGELLHGIFDNAITNAVCVYLMKYCDLPDHVVFAFTGDEEAEEDTEEILTKLGLKYQKKEKLKIVEEDDEIMAGAFCVCEYLDQMRKDFRAIVLDVTCVGFDDSADFTIENDFIYKKDKKWMQNMQTCALDSDLIWKFVRADRDEKSDNSQDYYSSDAIIKSLPEEIVVKNAWGRPEEVEEDETYEYDFADISCIALCLPCNAERTCQYGDMHDPNGFGIRKKSYMNYIRIVRDLCHL